ncbi:MAG: LamG domain-containing protein [bacterium]
MTGACLLTSPALSATIGDDLLAYWQFDEGSGTTTADYKGEANGTTSGGIVWTTGADAKYGGALRYDGADGCVLLPTGGSLANPSTSAMTFSVWLKADEAVGSIVGSYRSIFNSSAGQDYYICYYDKGNNQLRLKVSSTNSGITRIGIAGADVPVDTWYHFAGVYDGTNTIVYLNGVQKSSLTGASGQLKDGQVSGIGVKGASAQQYWKGVIDDLAIWKRALPVDQIQFICNSNKPVKDILNVDTAVTDWALY